MIDQAVTQLDLMSGALAGEHVNASKRTLGDLVDIFEVQQAAARMDPGQTAYEVQAHMVVEEGKEGGLFFGTSTVFPGLVGDESMMTRGHFHARRDTAEYYWGIQGNGMLILMDEDRNCRAEKVIPGSLHYIPGHVAHRLCNIGDEVLRVGACWPSEAGHDYESIAREGFSKRLKCVNGVPELV